MLFVQVEHNCPIFEDVLLRFVVVLPILHTCTQAVPHDLICEGSVQRFMLALQVECSCPIFEDVLLRSVVVIPILHTRAQAVPHDLIFEGFVLRFMLALQVERSCHKILFLNIFC